jgi:hypothetical protein
MYGKSAIDIKGRSNFTVSNNRIHDFIDHGVNFHAEGTVNNTTSVLTSWATGNKFNYNIITNSAGGSVLPGGYFRGAIGFNLQDSFEVIGNTCNQSGRGVNGNGWCMKMLQNYQNVGGIRKGKILYNKFTRDLLVGDNFAFIIEGAIIGDETEIAYNTMWGGAIDINGTFLTRGLNYSMDVHENTFGSPVPSTDCTVSKVGGCGGDIAMDLEFNTNYVWVRKNIFRNLGLVIDYEFHNAGALIHDIHFENNLGYNLCTITGGNAAGTNIEYNMYHINNTMIGQINPTVCSGQAGWNTGAGGYNFVYRNNIVTGFGLGPSNFFSGKIMDTVSDENNLHFGNGHSNTLWFNGTTAVNYLTQNNVISDPLFNNGTSATVTAGSFTSAKVYNVISIGTTDFVALGLNPIYRLTAGSFVIGKTYTITSVGTTSFISVGAASDTVGVTFVATGVGSGTGTATDNDALGVPFTASGVGSGTGTAGAFDYSLQTGSPAKTVGMLDQVEDDLKNKLRSSATVSIGALEF